MCDAGRDPNRALRRYDKAGVLGAHGHEAGGGEQDLGARMVVHGIDHPSGVFVVQRDHGPFNDEQIGAVLHHISPRETLAFRPASDSDARSAACIPWPAFVDVFEGVMGRLVGILYGCPALDLPLFWSCRPWPPL